MKTDPGWLDRGIIPLMLPPAFGRTMRALCLDWLVRNITTDTDPAAFVATVRDLGDPFCASSCDLAICRRRG